MKPGAAPALPPPDEGQTSRLNEALAAWRALLGEEHVTTDAGARAAAETATFATSRPVAALLRPGDIAALRECLVIANRFATPVYPVSAGKNWGYGSRVPAFEGCAIVSLERLDRILDFDERLATITVEPGVTFGQVHRFLRERGSDLMLGAPGSTAEASLIGNVVERGITGGLDGDRATRICALEVVLPDGDIVRTGFSRFPGSAASKLSAHGVGPSLDGLFLQSNLGIVTKMTFWLTPLPKFHQYFSFAIRGAARFGALVDTLQAIRREALIQTNFGLYNAHKMLTYVRRFPAGASQEEALDLSAQPADYLAPLQGCAWFGEGAITAPGEEIGDAKRRLLEARLAASVDLLDFLAPGAANGLVGTEVGDSLASIYWRKAGPVPADPDPDRDGCGLIWICPVAPFRSADLTRCVALLEEGMIAFGFEPIVGIQCHSLRAAHVVASIVYDRARPGDDARALACHDAVLKRLTGEGFIPYRLAAPAMAALPESDGAYGRMLRQLKEALDPGGILAPGRYDLQWTPAPAAERR